MKASEFDNRLRQLAAADEVEAPPAGWQKLAQSLPPSKKGIGRIPILPWLTGLGMAAAIAVGAGVYWNHKARLHTEPNLVVVNSTNQQEKQPASPNEILSPNAPTTNPLQPSRILPIKSTPISRLELAKIKEQNSTLLPKYSREPHVYQELPPKALIVKEVAPQLKFNPGKPMIAKKVQPLENTPVIWPESFVPSTSLGVAGAYQQSAEHGAYAVGLNVRQMIGKKVFVEGDVAYINTKSENTGQIYDGTFNFMSTNNGATAGRQARPVVNTVQVGYVQVAPAIGIQASEKLSFGAGPDMQKLLLQKAGPDQQIVRIEEDQAPQLIPEMDWGLTGKAEYKLSTNLKAGVQYRKGMNNVVRSGNDEYTERNYFQVQLKFFILNR